VAKLLPANWLEAFQVTIMCNNSRVYSPDVLTFLVKCERERERESVYVCVYMCVCLCSVFFQRSTGNNKY